MNYKESEPEKENYIQEIGSKTEFNYTGNYQEYETQDTGYYYVECYGASGGQNNWAGSLLSNFGTGGYTSGIIKLNKCEKIYVYVGQQGANGITTSNTLNSSSFNGGGSGGGISATGCIWKYYNTEVTNHTYNATQTTGYKFGIGQNAITLGNAGGAGGGYYGGYSSIDNPAGGAGGGSGFISGYDGCDAISENSTEDNIIHTGQSIHYSGKCFTNAILLDGNNNNNNIPNKNTDNGYATITFLNSNYDNSLILYNLLK